MAKKGDIVVAHSEKTGERARTGLVLSVMGQILKIRWDDETETMFIPGPGTLTVVGHERNRKLLGAGRRRQGGIPLQLLVFEDLLR